MRRFCFTIAAVTGIVATQPAPKATACLNCGKPIGPRYQALLLLELPTSSPSSSLKPSGRSGLLPQIRELPPYLLALSSDRLGLKVRRS
jgi:hypothetical protein